MKVRLKLNYDYDPELGYTEKGIDIGKDEINICGIEKDYIIVNLYREDIEELLKGTGIIINGC